jgi:hypothetical protein
LTEVPAHLFYVIVCGIAITAFSCIGGLFLRGKDAFRFAFIVFSFAVLGFVTGSIMSDSREPAVNAVLPATLTLLGALGAYIMGFGDTDKQSIVSSIVLCFATSLFVGSIYGSWIREEIQFSYEGREERKNGLQYESDLDRLVKYVEIIHLRDDFEKKYGIDLSGFASYFEATQAGDENEKSRESHSEKREEAQERRPEAVGAEKEKRDIKEEENKVHDTK